MKYYTTKPGEYPEDPKNSQDEFFGNGWRIKTTEGRFYLHYVSGSLQGQLKTIEISSEEAALMKNGSLTLDDICAKYGIY